MNKKLFLSEKDRCSEEGPLDYEKAKPVTTLKAKRDAEGFFTPRIMFRPLSDKGAFSELLGDRSGNLDIWLNRDLLMKEAYEHEIERWLCRIRQCEIEMYWQYVKEDRTMELYRQGKIQNPPTVSSEKLRKIWLDAVIWKYDFIQQHKKNCFQFAEAVIARIRRNEDVHGGNKIIEEFIEMTNKMPEGNRCVLDEMYSIAWRTIYAFKYDVRIKNIPAPWYDKVGGTEE